MKAEEAIKEFAKKVSVKATFAGAIGIDNNWLVEPLTALISEHYYPKEFTKWIGFNSSTLYYRDVDEKWIKTRFVISENPSEEYDEYTIDELFNYWKENVK